MNTLDNLLFQKNAHEMWEVAFKMLIYETELNDHFEICDICEDYYNPGPSGPSSVPCLHGKAIMSNFNKYETRVWHIEQTHNIPIPYKGLAEFFDNVI